MSATIISTNMGLPIPVTGVESGPNWANDINACLVTLDAHDHSQGKGVAITPAGINISTDLPFLNNNATLLRTVRFNPPGSQPALASDVNALYAFGVDLYYRDGSGNQVRITQSGGVTGAPGNITGLAAPATVTFVGGSSSYVFQSAANTPGGLDGASLILRNLTANSKGLTLAPPASMAADFTITLPSLPGSGTALATINSSGAMGTTAPDASTIVNTGGVLKVPTGGITPNEVVLGFGLIPSGAILPFGGAAAPTGYLLCDGTSYLRATYSNLFAAIGSAFGSADGTHFNVPDLRGQFLRGWDHGAGRDPNASARTAMATGGNTGDAIGSIQGDALRQHVHSISGTGVGAGSSGASSNTVISDATGVFPTSATNATGGSESRPTNAGVNYIIKT